MEGDTWTQVETPSGVIKCFPQPPFHIFDFLITPLIRWVFLSYGLGFFFFPLFSFLFFVCLLMGLIYQLVKKQKKMWFLCVVFGLAFWSSKKRTSSFCVAVLSVCVSSACCCLSSRGVELRFLFYLRLFFLLMLWCFPSRKAEALPYNIYKTSIKSIR